MNKLLLVLFFALLSCNHKQPIEDTRDYTATHKEALTFCQENKFNEDFYFLIDMTIHSGKNRFFVYDFKTKSFTHQNLVTHGTCDVFEDNPEKYKVAKFSNTPDSHCSMLGKYKIGKRDYSSWGIRVKYWLHGLETTNSNAVKRVVVLHSWSAVPSTEIYPRYAPLSWGCPAVSDAFMQELDAQLATALKPVLLWIVN